jgi:diguanylate cyclase (GGDEF)-like protein
MAVLRRDAWLLGLLLASVFTAGRAIAGAGLVGNLCLLALILTCVLATVIGPRLQAVADLRPWGVFTLASLPFLAEVMITADWTPLAVTTAVVPVLSFLGSAGYLGGLIWLLRGSGAVQAQALLDGLIICLSMAGVGYALLLAPATMPSGAALALLILACYKQLIDIGLVLAVLAMAFTRGHRSASLYGLLGSATAMAAGDIGIALLKLPERVVPSWLEVIYLLAPVALIACTLHPSVGRLSELGPRRLAAWSTPRLALVLLTVVTPVLLLAVGGGRWLDDERMSLAFAALAGVLTLAVRAMIAVRAHTRVERDLHHQALHDVLTGLPNRAGLLERARAMMQDAGGEERAWLLAVDLDGFGYVNDTWGHDVGDRLLLAVTQRITAAAPSDAVVARIGGDEFVLLVRSDPGGAAALADKLCALMRDSLLVDRLELMVTASFGLAGQQPGGDAQSLLRDADSAMYRAKAEGRNRVVSFDRRIREQVKDRVEIEHALRQAINRDQLHVVYQPIIELDSQHVVGAEALLRWNHPTLGPVPPGQFIPIAEETGLILDIGAWVLGEAARCLAGWRTEGLVALDFAMAVNVSTRQLRDRELRDTVDTVLRTTGLPAKCLVLEITESAMLEDPDVTIDVLTEVRALGVGLSVDDFGTGYSSLAYLSRLPVSVVKLDRTFIEGIGHRRYDEAIVRAVQAIAVVLQLDLIAEGVETVEQRDALRALGVPTAQGWLWGAAVKPDVFIASFGSGVLLPEPSSSVST